MSTEELPVFGTHVVLDKGDRRVELEWIGEGRDGDYDASDSDDYPHLRFNLMQKDGEEWQDIENTSYCCQVDARSSDEIKSALAEMILETVADTPYPKRVCERLSWATTADVEAGMASSGPRR